MLVFQDDGCLIDLCQRATGIEPLQKLADRKRLNYRRVLTELLTLKTLQNSPVKKHSRQGKVSRALSRATHSPTIQCAHFFDAYDLVVQAIVDKPAFREPQVHNKPGKLHFEATRQNFAHPDARERPSDPSVCQFP